MQSGYTLAVRRPVWAIAVFATASLLAQSSAPAADPTPQSLQEFQATATRVLEQAGVPGAGIALVRRDAVEWAGGIGYADRDAKTPVTADTHFRVGSISKTFVAMALVQLSEDGTIELDATVAETAPEVAIDNPWHDTAPVRIIHLLQHTAGFDDMHFNERYVPADEAERTLEDVLKINPNSRRVRWKPGTHTSYSNPGYGVAGLILEKAAEEPYEDYIAREIFEPLQMTTSSFRMTTEDQALMAKGYAGPTGPAVGYPQIYMRPAGNMHSSPREMAQFIRMLLGFGELGEAFVVDPEYLGSMEQPQTTLAAAAGLRNGYGTGIYATLDLPYRLLGHNGGIDGFFSNYAYSPSRDVGFVVLLNSTGSGSAEAMRRLSRLAIQYLKRDVEPPSKPEIKVDASVLDRYAGYYHDANPRNQFVWAFQWLLAGRTIEQQDGSLYSHAFFGERVRLVPVTEAAFRLENQLDASRVFTSDEDGNMVLTGPSIHAERRPRWRVDVIRFPVFASPLIVASVFAVAIVWVARIRRARPRGFWRLKLAMLLCPIGLLLPAVSLSLTPDRTWGVRNAGTTAVFLGTLAIPILAAGVAALAINAAWRGASRLLIAYAAVVSLAMAGLSLYLSSHDLLGVRLWTY
jgi:CubicO group peptidase (beta-lactamase class C family)